MFQIDQSEIRDKYAWQGGGIWSESNYFELRNSEVYRNTGLTEEVYTLQDQIQLLLRDQSAIILQTLVLASISRRFSCSR